MAIHSADKNLILLNVRDHYSTHNLIVPKEMEPCTHRGQECLPPCAIVISPPHHVFPHYLAVHVHIPHQLVLAHRTTILSPMGQFANQSSH